MATIRVASCLRTRTTIGEQQLALGSEGEHGMEEGVGDENSGLDDSMIRPPLNGIKVLQDDVWVTLRERAIFADIGVEAVNI